MERGSTIRFVLRSLRHRNYRLFFTGQSLSLIGTWMTQIATSWLIYRVTNSAWLLGFVGFSGQLPAFFLAPFAGVRRFRGGTDRRISRIGRRRVSAGISLLADGACRDRLRGNHRLLLG